MPSSSYDDDDAEFLAFIIERVQRASRAFKVLDEAELIVFNEIIKIELEG